MQFSTVRSKTTISITPFILRVIEVFTLNITQFPQLLFLNIFISSLYPNILSELLHYKNQDLLL